MAQEVPVRISIPNDQNLTLHRYRAVSVGADGKVVKPDDPLDFVIGILDMDVRAGGTASVQVGGVAPTMAGGVFSAGDPITIDAQSRAVRAVSGNRGFGIALESAAGAGEIVAVLLTPVGIV
ncbi:DUF2190 family protein [Tumebacillus permanentifrigoris]|uniref:Uncharacterized protein DUF2190 n=1 Tax=Tumebacillus permanentifrigoris TaxID=378543 RepID=A0A316D4U1_9BACL|nr:DUF2190 family protein [Tumebacillus permanentifrigoris]PWK07504.1 uncharacterized protein DUF2190 [Tumebacillus permanentifrigoris]